MYPLWIIKLRTKFKLFSHVAERQLLKIRYTVFVHGEKSNYWLTDVNNKMYVMFRDYYLTLYSSESPTEDSLITNFLKSLNFPVYHTPLDARCANLQRRDSNRNPLLTVKKVSWTSFLVKSFKSFAPQPVPLVHSIQLLGRLQTFLYKICITLIA